MKRPRALSSVLVITVLSASVLVWAAIYGVGILLMYWPASGGFDRQLRIFADGLVKVAVQDVEPDVLRQSLLGVNLVVSEFAGDVENNSAVGFNLWRADGEWAAGSPNVPRVHAGAVGATGFFDAVLNGEEYRVYARWTADRAYQVEVLHSARGRRTDFNSVMLSPASIVAPLLVGLPLLLLPVLFVVRYGLKPLRKLSDELSARKPDDLTPIQMGDLVSELRPVVDEVNGTMERLDALLRRERNFLADAAHELRTPLAVISAQVDDVLHAGTPEARKEAERGLQAGLGRVNRLVSQLLMLARFEARADKGEPADVADVVRDVLAAHAPEARARSIQLAYRGPDQVPVGCAHHTLESALSNLISNAIRYGREGGQVVVRIDLEASLAFIVSVCDDGPGLPEMERARMFDRFWRGSENRASGSGLGLAIVAAAVRQHNARIHVTEGIGGEGLCVIVNVPSPEGVYFGEG